MLDWLPSFLQSEPARTITGIAAGAIGLGLLALIAALASYAKVLGWRQTSARILRSAPGFEMRQRFQSEPPRNERIASIAYEYEVAGKTYRSGRILDAGYPPEDDVDRLLAAYPQGAAVTIRYDPKDPAKAALEINRPPKDLALGCLTAILLIAIFAAIAIWLSTVGIAQLRALFPRALLQAMIPTALLALVFVLCFVVGARHSTSIRAWPQTPGRIVRSDVHRFQMRRDKTRTTARGRSSMRTAWMPVVEYAYTVGGRDLTSRSVWADTEVSGSEDYAGKIAGRYPVGMTVTVRYDPAKPARSALEPPGRLHWLFLVGAAVSLAAAVATSGLVGWA